MFGNYADCAEFPLRKVMGGGGGITTLVKWSRKQLDVDVSPPVFVWNPYLILTLVIVNLDPCDL